MKIVFIAASFFVSFSAMAQLPVVEATGGETSVDWPSAYEAYQKEFKNAEGPGFLLGQCSQGVSPVDASSELTGQGDNDYGIGNMQDDNPLTAWVEGKADYGIGEWFEVRAVNVNTLYNGYQKSPAAFKNNSRVKQFKVYKNGEAVCLLNLVDKMGAQYFELPGTTEGEPDWDNPDTWRFEITEVYKGAKWKDVAITEIDYVLCCFGAATLIEGPEKDVVASALENGSEITTIDPETGVLGNAQVSLTTSQVHLSVYSISTETKNIEITSDHPIFAEGYGFVSIDQLITTMKVGSASALVDKISILVWNEEAGVTVFETLKSVELKKGEFKTYAILKISGGTAFIANGIVTTTY